MLTLEMLLSWPSNQQDNVGSTSNQSISALARSHNMQLTAVNVMHHLLLSLCQINSLDYSQVPSTGGNTKMHSMRVINDIF